MVFKEVIERHGWHAQHVTGPMLLGPCLEFLYKSFAKGVVTADNLTLGQLLPSSTVAFSSALVAFYCKDLLRNFVAKTDPEFRAPNIENDTALYSSFFTILIFLLCGLLGISTFLNVYDGSLNSNGKDWAYFWQYGVFAFSLLLSISVWGLMKDARDALKVT